MRLSCPEVWMRRMTFSLRQRSRKGEKWRKTKTAGRHEPRD
jgi:hypothetical protein